MAWTTNPYCTLADVKVAIDPQMGTGDDTWINSLILMAQADLDREIGYPFQTDGTTQVPTTRVFDGVDNYRMKVSDLLTLTQVQEIYHNTQLGSNGVWISGTTTTYDITADILTRPNNQPVTFYLMRNSGLPFQQGLQNYHVSGVWGYPTDATQIYPGIPADITRIAVRLVIHYYKMRDSNYSDYTSEQGGVRQKYNKTMPNDVLEVIARYQHSIFIDDW